jgi:hypothetical protein
MTHTAVIASPTGVHIRAGLEFSPGEIAGFLTVLAVAVLGAAFLLAAFVTALVNSAQQLHQAGRLRHPAAAVAFPVAALVLAYVSRSTLTGPLSALAGLAFGYAIMWRSGRGWFRWTALPVLCWTVTLVGTTR